MEELDLYDYPLDYDVVQEGAFYHDEAISEDEITWQYAVVKPDFVFPNVQYELLERLVLTPYDSYVTAKAYELTGNHHDFHVLDNNGAVEKMDPLAGDPCLPGCPNYPACLDDPYVGCEETITPPSTGGGGTNPDPPCNKNHPEWPDCLMVVITPGTSTHGDVGMNDCGCPVYDNPRYPAGCVNLNDTQFAELEGVRNVEIRWTHNLFQSKKTSTDDNGCWRIRLRTSGNAKMRIRFDNNRRVIRAMRGLRIWEYSFAVDSDHSYHAPPYNNSNVVFNTDDNDNSHAKKRWYAATANNALYEYDDFAAADGILPPPRTLDILLVNQDNSAAAPMLSEMLKNNTISIGSNIAAGAIIISSSEFFNTFLPGAGPLAGGVIATVGPPLWLYVKNYAPDVLYSYGAETAATNPSDDVKDIFYHEYAHASHYHGLDDDFYWLGNVATIAANGGNGDGTQANSERIAISEAWAATIGAIYADRRYGLSHSNSPGTTNPIVLNRNRHIFRHEQFDALGSPEPFIPEGLFWDCIDNNADNPANVNEAPLIVDGVRGYTISNCFNAVSNTPQALADVRTDLIAVLPAGQAPGAVLALFLSYGF